MTHTLRVWMKFNTVGLLGAAVQLITLTVLKSIIGLNYLPATAIAVETAVLHNFVWHERWTWLHRTQLKESGMFRRLVRFHLANGLISIVGNILLMSYFVSRLNLHYFLANILAIAACSILNFLASNRLVFS